MRKKVIIPRPCTREECNNIIPRITKSGNIKSYSAYQKLEYCGQHCANLVNSGKNSKKAKLRSKPTRKVKVKKVEASRIQFHVEAAKSLDIKDAWLCGYLC